MKLYAVIGFLFLVNCSPSLTSHAFAGGASTGGDEAVGAIEVTVYGKQMAPDHDFNTKVFDLMIQSLVASRTTDGHVVRWAGKAKKYVLVGRGDEGGQTFCLEMDSGTATPDFFAVRDAFKALEADVPDDTSYSVKSRVSCRTK